MPPLNRRAFLRTLAGGLAGAAVPQSVAKAASAPSVAPAATGLDPRTMLPPALNSGFALPHTGGEIVMLNGDAVVWNEDWLGNLTKDQMLAQRAILEDARRAMPTDSGRPMAYNHLTKQWHEQALLDPVPPGGNPDSWRQVYLRAGERAPDSHNLLQTEQYLPEDFAESAYSGGTLTAGPQAYEGKDLVSGYEDSWWQDRRGTLQYELSQKGGNAKEMAKSDEGLRLVQEQGLAPGGRYQTSPSLRSDASQLTGNMGLPGDTPTERTGRIRRLLAMGVPIAAATAMASQASASEPQDKGMIPVEGKPGTFAFPDDIDAVDAFPAEDLRFQRATPVPYPTRDEAFQMYRSGLLHSAQEDGMAMARASAAYEQQYDSVVGQRTKELVAQGVDPVNAELRATKEFELGRPTIRKAGGGAMSPNEFLANFVVQNAGQFGVPEDQISGAVDMARQYVTSGGYGSELDKAAHQMLLGILEANAPQGFESDRSGIGQEELDRLRQKYGDNANFMYPDWQRTNFDALRQYELLSHGTDLFEPGHASNEVLKVAGGVFNPEGLFGGSFTKGYTPDTPEGDALYWYKLSRNTGSQEPGYHSYRDPDTNDARFWKHSTTTLSGLLSGGLSGEDTSRRYGRAAAYTMPLGQNPTVPAWQRQLLTDVRTNTNRDVPVIPTNKTPQQMSQAHALVEAYDKSARDWLPTAYRRTFRQHPTQFQSMLFGLIHDSTDPATAVDAAVSVVGGGALGAYRNVAKSAGKGVARSIAKGAATGVAGAVPRHLAEEASYGAGQSALLSPLSALVTPDTDNPLAQREDGSFAQPTDRDFDAVTGINTGNWRDVLGKASSQYYGKKK